MNFQEVKEKLKVIPHLKLGKIDISSLIQKEIDNIPKFYDYERPGDDKEKYKLYANSWKVVGLIDSTQDPSLAAKDGRSYQGSNSFGNGGVLTEIGKMMPNTLNLVYNLVEAPMRVRISKFVPKGHLHWHSHNQYNSGNYINTEYFKGVLHIPLRTNKNVKFGVTKFPIENYGINPIWQHYDVGEIWLFNSWEMHNIFNDGDSDRIHIMFYFNFFDKKIISLLKEKVEEYKGPFL